MSPSDPNETMTSAAVTILALFRDSSQGELEMPGASGWSGLADHGVVITGSASSLLVIASIVIIVISIYPDPALHLALASRSFLVLCTFLRTAVLQRTLGSGSSSSPSHLSGCRADPQRLKAGDRAVQDCIYTSLTSVISHFAPRTRFEFVLQPYQTSNNRPPPRQSFHPPHIRRQSTSSPMSSILFKRPTMLALAGVVTLMSFIPTAEAQYRRPYGYNTRRRGGW
jgi:hypothetical protein